MHENNKMKLSTKLGKLNAWNDTWNLSEFNSKEKLMNVMNECYA